MPRRTSLGGVFGKNLAKICFAEDDTEDDTEEDDIVYSILFVVNAANSLFDPFVVTFVPPQGMCFVRRRGEGATGWERRSPHVSRLCEEQKSFFFFAGVAGKIFNYRGRIYIGI